MKLSQKILCITTAFIAFNAIAATPSTPCTKDDAPKVVKPMADWQIIAPNTGIIDIAPVFSGNHLVFSVSSQPENKGNLVRINERTGILKVTAVKKDKFDVEIKAKNDCGAVTSKLNVGIDEEI